MGSFKLPKSDLLRKGWEFDQVYRQGKRLHGNGFSLIIYGNNLGHSRLGISIHRQLRGVVRRNRIKRLIRESFRLRRDLYPQQSDIVMTVRPDWISSGLSQVNEMVSGLVMRK
ncbi:MAG: ribonuclease P protein component [Desulfobulbaceae bacterium]|uniref:Ribonuclease P protein component n=1 Tax=Candidatus Desulfatifera sulfidica TaxID=2841691 RepID=A0A8J6TE00_9BACT|nr:ribonuclease P protein component [Candidatus Desulfatifera sulfidica]